MLALARVLQLGELSDTRPVLSFLMVSKPYPGGWFEMRQCVGPAAQPCQ